MKIRPIYMGPESIKRIVASLFFFAFVSSCRYQATNTPTALPSASPNTITEKMTPSKVIPTSTATITQFSTPRQMPTSTQLPSIQFQVNWQLKSRMMIPAISFLSLEEGWAASEYQLIHTMDGGKTWHMVADTPETFFLINFVNPLHGWGLGKNWLYITLDGGKTWKQQYAGPFDVGFAYWGTSIDFVDDQIGWLTDSNNLFQTMDGGFTWNKLKTLSFPVGNLLSVSFSSPEKGWLMNSQCVMPSCRLVLYKTTDTGRTWNPVIFEWQGQETEILPWIRPPDEIFFLDDQHGWFVGSLDYLGAFTDDGGRTWNNLQPASYHGGGGGAILHQVHMFTPLQGIADYRTGSYYAVVKTEDGGNNWTQIFPPSAPNLYLKFFDAENGIGLSGGDFRSGSALSTINGGFLWQEWDFQSPCNRGHMIQTQFVSGNTGWVLCDENPYALYRTADGGKTWQLLTTPNIHISLEYFWDAQSGIICDGFSGIFGTGDGGKSWKLVDINQEKFPLQKDQAGWIFDNNQTIYHASNADSHWIPVLRAGYVSQFDGVSSDVAYVSVGYYSQLLKTVDGGKIWQSIAISGIIEQINYFYISFVDANQGWLASNQGIFRTDDGGQTWDQISPSIIK